MLRRLKLRWYLWQRRELGYRVGIRRHKSEWWAPYWAYVWLVRGKKPLLLSAVELMTPDEALEMAKTLDMRSNPRA